MVPIQKIKRFNLRGKNSHKKTFGTSIVPMPRTLGRMPIYVYDQGTTNYCTAAGHVAAGSYLFNLRMGFEYQAAKESEINGTLIIAGADPAIADKVAEEYGFLPDQSTPCSFQKCGWITPADWRNYPPTLEGHSALFRVGPPLNVFPDFASIKEALWQGKDDGAVVIANAFWFDNWQDSDSILPMPGNVISRHEYIFLDFTTINNVDYLVAQLSQGTEFGNGGTFLMSEGVVNAAFKKPAFNGLGCVIFRKGVVTPMQTTISLYTRLLMVLGEIYDILKER